MTSPSSPDYMVRGLFDRIAALESRVAFLEGQRSTTFEHARVETYIGGSTCVVRYPNYAAGETPASATLTGPTRVLPFAYPVYTPVVGHNVIVLNCPAWSGVFFATTAF